MTTTTTTMTMNDIEFTSKQIDYLDNYYKETVKSIIYDLFNSDDSGDDDDGFDEDKMTSKLNKYLVTDNFKRIDESDFVKKLGVDGDISGKGKGKGKTAKDKKVVKTDGKKKKSKVKAYSLFMFGENKDGEISKIKAGVDDGDDSEINVALTAAEDKYKTELAEYEANDSDDKGKAPKKPTLHTVAFSIASSKWSNMSDDDKQKFQDRADELNAEE